MRNYLSKTWDFLEGKKTFIGAVIIFVAGGLKALGKIDDSLFQAIIAFGGAVSAFGLRDAISKLRKK